MKKVQWMFSSMWGIDMCVTKTGKKFTSNWVRTDCTEYFDESGTLFSAWYVLHTQQNISCLCRFWWSFLPHPNVY